MDARFVLARMERARLDGADLSGARFEQALLPSANLDHGTLERASFAGADVRRASLHRVVERDTSWTDARLEHARRTDPDRARAEDYHPSQEREA